jgi:fructose-1,6-bisphosphatase/inositol monophosphatase family enzyme
MIYLPFIQDQLTKAAQTASTYFGKVSGVVKPGDSNQVLTEADLAIGKQVVAAIQASYPNHNIIDEEAGALWTAVDGAPLDYSNPLTKTDQNFTFCVASPILHKQLRDIINRRLSRLNQASPIPKSPADAARPPHTPG